MAKNASPPLSFLMGSWVLIFMKCVTREVCHFVRKRCCDEWTKLVLFILRNFRKQTGLSQKAFAQTVDLPTRTYRSYETGEED